MNEIEKVNYANKNTHEHALFSDLHRLNTQASRARSRVHPEVSIVADPEAGVEPQVRVSRP